MSDELTLVTARKKALDEKSFNKGLNIRETTKAQFKSDLMIRTFNSGKVCAERRHFKTTFPA